MKFRDGVPICDQCKEGQAVWKCLICEETSCQMCALIHDTSRRTKPAEPAPPLIEDHEYMPWEEVFMGGQSVRHASACKLCGQPASAHRSKG